MFDFYYLKWVSKKHFWFKCHVDVIACQMLDIIFHNDLDCLPLVENKKGKRTEGERKRKDEKVKQRGEGMKRRVRGSEKKRGREIEKRRKIS